jgi:hypothetical protein
MSESRIIETMFMNEKIAKKIFKKEQAEELLDKYKPELFGLKTKRSKKIKYLGNNLYLDICSLDINIIKEYTRDYSINIGKYSEIHKDPEYFKTLINITNINKKDSPCHPERFSESVVKPCIRKYINEKRTDDLEKYLIENLMKSLIKHGTERTNQQVKADWSEYLILMNCPNIIPTLKQTKGTDMYLIKDDGSIEDLDIKTTRSIWEIKDKKEAIKKLYEGQGEDRFSANPRLYIYLSDKDLCNSEDIIKQMNENYDIEFKYKKEVYKVIGCRLIII